MSPETGTVDLQADIRGQCFLLRPYLCRDSTPAPNLPYIFEVRCLHPPLHYKLYEGRDIRDPVIGSVAQSHH